MVTSKSVVGDNVIRYVTEKSLITNHKQLNSGMRKSGMGEGQPGFISPSTPYGRHSDYTALYCSEKELQISSSKTKDSFHHFATTKANKLISSHSVSVQRTVAFELLCQAYFAHAYVCSDWYSTVQPKLYDIMLLIICFSLKAESCMVDFANVLFQIVQMKFVIIITVIIIYGQFVDRTRDSLLITSSPASIGSSLSVFPSTAI